MTTNYKHQRFPRLDGKQQVWKGVPGLDLSKIRPSRWVIDFFLARSSVQLIYGSFGTRKTTAMLLAAWSVAQGIPFFGRKTRQRPVLYLDFENPPDVLKSYCQDLHIDPSHSAFRIWDRAAKATPMPADETLVKFVQQCIKTTGRAPWIIFDSWTSLLKAGDSGDKIGETAPIFRAIRHLCDIGATCTIIDHTGKSKRKDPIGSSAKMTQMDTSHYFETQKNDNTLPDSDSSSTVVRVQSFLKRYAPEHVGTFSFEAKAAVDLKGKWHLRSLEPVTDISVLRAEKAVEGMKQLITNNPKLGHEDLADKAAAEGIVRSRNAGRRILDAGAGKYWEVSEGAKGRKAYRVR
jgi:AAA domain